MAGIILLLLIAVPAMEIAVFIQAGEIIGLWPTLAIIILTAFAGAALLRRQGLATLQRAQDSINAGRPPVAELFDGLCLFVAGLLLLTPGFITDTIGLLLFAPPLRAFIMGGLVRRISASMVAGGAGFTAREDYRDDRGATVIDGEYHEVKTGPEAENPKDGEPGRPDRGDRLPPPK